MVAKNTKIAETYLVSVVPISKGARGGALTYFSGEFITPGLFVSVSVRKKNILALVAHFQSFNDV